MAHVWSICTCFVTRRRCVRRYLFVSFCWTQNELSHEICMRWIGGAHSRTQHNWLPSLCICVYRHLPLINNTCFPSVSNGAPYVPRESADFGPHTFHIEWYYFARQMTKQGKLCRFPRHLARTRTPTLRVSIFWFSFFIFITFHMSRARVCVFAVGVAVTVVIPNKCFEKAFWLICLRTWFDYDMCNTRTSASIFLPPVKCHITRNIFVSADCTVTGTHTHPVARMPIATTAVAADASFRSLLLRRSRRIPSDDQPIFFPNAISANIYFIHSIVNTWNVKCFCAAFRHCSLRKEN